MAYIDFRAESHEYFVDGVRIPSVTEILGPLYDWSGIPPAVLATAAARGTAVHRACELLDWDMLAWDSLDDRVRPYVEAYLAFLQDTGFRPELIERVVYSAKHRFCGTLDRAGALGRSKVLVDLKSGVITPVTGPQTAAYADALLEDLDWRCSRRYGLYLRPGKYKLVRYDDAGDWTAFRSALNLKTWRQNHGI